MSVGPVGLSAGVLHHVVADKNCGQVKVHPKKGFRMFEHCATGDGNYLGERLTLGRWTGISGAAVSTGLGSRTSLSLSLLLGMFNVRLGYWWDSQRRRRMGSRLKREGAVGSGKNRIGRAFAFLFPAHSYLLDEFLARFHGTGRALWNLSDGGHFENLGVYELIRRRVPVMVVVDAEADPDYAFEGLGNLVRKARADFGAIIEFVPEERMCQWRDHRPCGTNGRYFGSLDMLRRGSWESGIVPCCAKAGPPTFGESDQTKNSLVHAALATVRYEDSEDDLSIIVYIKPTLVGNEPVDIKHYHQEHPGFPQQSTADQFFDEAQWESYRALGELIGCRVLGPLKRKDVSEWLWCGLGKRQP